MPSSTSSSDVPHRDVPDRRFGLAWLICVSLVLVGVVGWEAFARSMQHKPGDYAAYANFTTQWAEERRKLDAPDNDVRVVLLGSSRMQWNADLDILEAQLGTRPLQLAIAGTGPILMMESVVNETDFDGLLLVGVTPFLFNRLDAGIFGQAALDWYHKPSPSELSGNWLHTRLTERLAFVGEGMPLFDLIDHYSNLPDRDGVFDLNSGEWKLGVYSADRQTDMWAPVEVPGSFDNEQILAFWMLGLGRPPETPERMQEMADSAIERFVPLIETLRSRGGDVVFIRMPSDGKYLEYDEKSQYDALTWSPMTEGFDALSINTMEYPELSTELEIPEWSHLSRRSQDDFSRRIVPLIERLYEERYDRSIHTVIRAND